ALLGLLIASGPTFLFSGGWTKPSSFWLASAPLDLSLTYNRILSMGGLACAYAWLIGTHGKALNPIGLVLMAAAAVLSYVIIGLAAPVVVLAIALTTGRRALAVFSAICALWIIGAFYYWLSWPLINKAYLLVVIGCAVGVLTYALFDHKADHADRQRSGYRQTMGGQPQALASVLIVASLGLSTAVNAAVIWENEQILANGRKVFVALAPRDPRSIMQGDYMALRFRMPAITSRSRRQAKEAELKWAIASVDAKNVATITTLTSDDVDVLRESQIKLQLKPGKRRPVLGTNAYFFKEGTAKTYQDARFGEFRVNEEGSAILVGLTDENLKRL
ncbi:MAG: GDYXXLXY domain-containing protein, partial [Pseudomonadota bacterium]